MRDFRTSRTSTKRSTTFTAHYREKIAIIGLAAMCQLSLRQFERKFKSYFNLSPTQYIMKMRIHEACDLLCNGSRPIGDIALRAGLLRPKLLHGAVQENHEHDAAAVPQTIPLSEGLELPRPSRHLSSRGNEIRFQDVRAVARRLLPTRFTASTPPMPPTSG